VTAARSQLINWPFSPKPPIMTRAKPLALNSLLSLSQNQMIPRL